MSRAVRVCVGVWKRMEKWKELMIDGAGARQLRGYADNDGHVCRARSGLEELHPPGSLRPRRARSLNRTASTAQGDGGRGGNFWKHKWKRQCLKLTHSLATGVSVSLCVSGWCVFGGASVCLGVCVSVYMSWGGWAGGPARRPGGRSPRSRASQHASRGPA